VNLEERERWFVSVRNLERFAQEIDSSEEEEEEEDFYDEVPHGIREYEEAINQIQ